jgi:hypothetical protein
VRGLACWERGGEEQTKSRHGQERRLDLTQLKCLEVTIEREKKIDAAAGGNILHEASRKGSLVNDANKDLSFSCVRGHLGNSSGARVWLSGCYAGALAPQAEEGDNEGERAGTRQWFGRIPWRTS